MQLHLLLRLLEKIVLKITWGDTDNEETQLDVLCVNGTIDVVQIFSTNNAYGLLGKHQMDLS